MIRHWRGATLAFLAAVVPLMAWQFSTQAQTAGDAPRRFQFQVVESFDAKYLGDTPGHLGRGSLHGARPDVALGDPVYFDGTKIGTITSLVWDRTKDSLEVEFDPEMFQEDEQGRPVRRNRVAIGEEVWIPLGGTSAPKAR